MTFEEFLTKKKIDLAQFQTAEPGLFTEFQSHYSQMGPKSFDHSKKFLFNKLRRAYHLKEEPKPVPVKEVIEVNEIAAQAEPLLSPSVEATVYTPRFRAASTSKKEEAESGKLKTESENQVSGTEDQVSGIENQVSSIEYQDTEKVKPAYVPRFKSQGTAKEEPTQVESGKENEDQVSGISNQDTEKVKPAYVPRFKAVGTTKASPQTPSSPETSDVISQTSDLRPQTSDNSPQTSDSAPKPAYVPRFKTPVTGKPAEERKDEAPEKPKPAYVPRFKPPKQ